jgi:hypothetical protein
MYGGFREFNDFTEKMNKQLPATGNLIILRRINPDANSCRDRAPGAAQKLLHRRKASMDLRYDDCVKQHYQQCYRHKVTKDQIIEVLDTANLGGGIIVISHTRKAPGFRDELEKKDYFS